MHSACLHQVVETLKKLIQLLLMNPALAVFFKMVLTGHLADATHVFLLLLVGYQNIGAIRFQFANRPVTKLLDSICRKIWLCRWIDATTDR